MSEEMMNHGHSSDETEFEHEDLGTRGIFVFLFGLVVSGLVIYFIIYGMYSFLDKYEKSQMKTASPLVTSTAAAAGVAHIPIDRAMDLTVGKLPVYSQATADTNTSVPSKTPAQKTATKGKSRA